MKDSDLLIRALAQASYDSGEHPDGPFLSHTFWELVDAAGVRAELARYETALRNEPQ